MKNPIKMDDLGGTPLFRKLSYVGLMIIDMHILGINTIHQLESLQFRTLE